MTIFFHALFQCVWKVFKSHLWDLCVKLVFVCNLLWKGVSTTKLNNDARYLSSVFEFTTSSSPHPKLKKVTVVFFPFPNVSWSQVAKQKDESGEVRKSILITMGRTRMENRIQVMQNTGNLGLVWTILTVVCRDSWALTVCMWWHRKKRQTQVTLPRARYSLPAVISRVPRYGGVSVQVQHIQGSILGGVPRLSFVQWAECIQSTSHFRLHRAFVSYPHLHPGHKPKSTLPPLTSPPYATPSHWCATPPHRSVATRFRWILFYPNPLNPNSRLIGSLERMMEFVNEKLSFLC